SYDPAFYSGLTVVRPSGPTADTVAFALPGPERNQWSGSVRVTTPTFRQFTASLGIAMGQVPLFRVAAPGQSRQLDATLDLRPTGSLRAAFQLTRLTLDRRRDGSRFSSETIPRLKIEYQLSRAIFFRLVGQYTARDRSALVDRNGNPILVDGVLDTGDR